MSHALLQRLRAALAPDFEVERELATGGMGTVYLARDVTLERRVAVKILRPELATAAAAERFLREARILANLNHPNAVSVHRAGTAGGLYFYVMDYVEGRTLAAVLSRGVLSPEEAIRLGGDLLDALEAAHASGVIHRDIKPANIFLLEDRALLGDFGVAKPSGEEALGLTSPGQRVGTPAYMAPEQLEGEATPRTDVYAVGMVLYEALTGRRWSVSTPVEAADWSDVPVRLRDPLRRALALAPADRWESARAFRAALVGAPILPTRRRGRRLGVGVALGAIAVAAALAFWIVRPASSVAVRDLAILPANIVGEGRTAVDGEELAILVQGRLESAPDISVVPARVSSAWWRSAEGGEVLSPERRAAAALGARYAARPTLMALPESTYLELGLFDARGTPVPGATRIAFGETDLRELSDSLTLRLLRVVVGGDGSDIGRLSASVDALIPFLQGEKAFQRGAVDDAVRFYEVAIAADSGFVRAWWHLANAWRWLGQPGPYDHDFRALFQRHGHELGRVDSLLMAAQLAAPGPPRLRLYRQAVRAAPLNDFAAFLYGEELFNRGPLWGEPLEHAVSVLEGARALNPLWAWTHLHLIWANIRLGRAEAAQAALRRLPQVAASTEGWRYPPELFQQAFLERFEPRRAAEARAAVLADSVFGRPEWLAVLSRLSGAFDVPQAQLQLGETLAARAPGVPGLAAAGHTAQGLALLALGRAEAAFVRFDSAAVLYDMPEARLQAAEWRALAPSLGVPASPDAVRTGIERLRSLAQAPDPSPRALWALGVAAYERGDLERARELTRRLETLPAARQTPQLVSLLRALDRGELGDGLGALSRSAPALDDQTRAVILQGGPQGGLGDPFARALLHLKRGVWLAGLGEAEAAEREWLWHEAVDIVGLPGLEPPQAGEIDWALGNIGRQRRGLSALARGDREAACRLLARVAELWDGAQGGHVVLAAEARAGARSACGRSSAGGVSG